MPEGRIRRTIRVLLPKKKVTIGKNEIMTILPHRGTMLLLDEAVISREVIRGQLLIGDEFCIGHAVFDGRLVFRGVDVPEMAAQLLGVSWAHQHPEFQNRIGFLGEIKGAKFHEPIIPGELLIVEMDPAKIRQKVLGGPELEKMLITVAARDILVRVKKERKATIASVKLAIIPHQGKS